MTEKRTLGIDIGSTTVKLTLLEGEKTIVQRYERHRSQVWEATLRLLDEEQAALSQAPFGVAITGSAGMGLAQAAQLPFVQEVYATAEAVHLLAPDTGLVIELGGEDAKVIFFAGGVDERMNGTCAGGTGAFIDQMASLMDMTVEEMDAASLEASQIYPIASRCGVFAKSDIQPLLNQGARKADVAASIYQAVVNQTITGLIQGRRIQGKVRFLGGPLHYCQGLRRQFVQTLRLGAGEAIFPDYDRFAVAIGAALYARENGPLLTAQELRARLTQAGGRMTASRGRLAPLFRSDEEYQAFVRRHARATLPRTPLATYRGRAYLGIDCGSTTTKLALIAEDRSLLYSYYSTNRGDPVSLVREQLAQIYDLCGERVQICGSAATGYGEELICHAFHVDSGVVETIAHYTAARYFRPEVDFILDIVGQDIKCFHIRNGLIDSILLNEACSSGCGSFLESFARSMNYTASEFAQAGLKATAPVDLGFTVRFSAPSNRKTYERGQFSIPSDTVCYPAKLMHGHVEELLDAGIRTLFYPGLTMNVDEGKGNNHYNCPVVAYYGETLSGNMDRLGDANFLHPYLSLDSAAALARTLYPSLHALDARITRRALHHAARAGFAAYEAYRRELAAQGEAAMAWAREHHRRIMVLAGRPYHIDPEVCHGIDRLASSLGFVVVSEDSICHLEGREPVAVLDQWTFHSRLYRAARYAADHADCELGQLVSFGCGIDAITTDEIRSLLERAGRFYTQIKIDEITNLGAVRIRLRSLLGALEEKEAAHDA